MTNQNKTIKKLSDCIGQTVKLNNELWKIHEVLTTESKLILLASDSTSIQTTAFGEPRREVAETKAFNIFESDDGVTDEVNNILKQLL